MKENSNYSSGEQESTINIREEFEKYLFYWRWFLLSLVIFVSIAFFYLRYSTPIYKATTTLLVKDDRKGGVANELAAFSELGMLSGAKNNVDNEIEIIKSKTLIEKTILELNLTIQYFNKGRVKDGELYDGLPIKAFFTNYDVSSNDESQSFVITGLSSDKYALFDSNNKKLGEFNFGQKIRLKDADLEVINQNSKNTNFSITIQLVPLKKMVQSFTERLNVSALSKNTSVIELSITDPNKKRAEEFLNTLVKSYNEDAISDKNYVSESTQNFIDQRLVLISKELKDVETDEESFKKNNKITDIPSEAGLFLDNASEYEKKVVENETQLKVTNLLSDYISNNENELIPASVIGVESGANEVIVQYNKLIIIRKNLVESGAGPDNPQIIALNRQIADLKSNVKASIASLRQTLEIKKRDLNRQGAILDGKISQIPTQEKEFRDLSRQQNIKQSLYLYLLEKREEAAISLAITSANAKVIDPAIASDSPVSPNNRIIYLGAFLIGLLIPFSVVYLIYLLDTKVKTRVDIEKNTNIPFLGDVPTSDDSSNIIKANSRSSSAEAMRIIRTNLEFLLNGKKDTRAKTIFVTSTFPKEGKTFISVNLAGTLALSGKKVLLIGMDIRNPKLDEYLAIPGRGLTNYLTSDGTSIASYIVKLDNYANFYVLPAGIIPPNPAELLMGERVELLFDQLKQDYDYIVVDTAPVGLVTDTFIINKFSDCFLYVVRANYLDKRMLVVPNDIYTEKKLNNMAVILNDTDVKKGYGYGYGYSYGYGVKVVEDSWFKKIVGFF